MYVLILTITFIGAGLTPAGSVAGFAVEGFKSQQACAAAGDAWIKVNTDRFTSAKAVCVTR